MTLELKLLKRVVFTAGLAAFVAGLSLLAELPIPRKAPELAFTLPGEGERLLSSYRGKVVAIEFILTTCPHCQAAARTMSKFQQEFGSRGFQALDLAINGVDDGRTPDQANQLVSAFAQQYQAAFPVGWIARDPMMQFVGFSMAERWVVPQLVIIDRKGMIRYSTPPTGNTDYEAMMKEDTIRQHIEELLNERAASVHRTAVAKKKTS